MDQKSNGYVEDINALRCFAMLGVMLVHCGIFPFGAWGVWLFFVISGFAITRSLISDKSQCADNSLVMKNFFIKRALRILPLYIAYLLMISAYCALTGRPGFWSALPYLMTFTYNIAMSFGSDVISAPGVSHLWSISGEEQFYIAFPFLFVLLRRRHFVYCMAAILVLSPVFRAVLASGLDWYPQDITTIARRVKFFTPAHFDSFAAGSLIALATSGREVTGRQGYLALGVGIAALVLYLGVYAIIQSQVIGQLNLDAFRNLLSGEIAGNNREVFSYTAVWLASAGVIIAVLARLPIVTIFCRPRIFHHMGKISYGGYVYHGLVIEILTNFVPGINQGGFFDRFSYFVILLVLSMAAAWASYRWLERPFLKLKPTYRRDSAALERNAAG